MRDKAITVNMNKRNQYQIKLESELYPPVKKLFETLGYIVKGEVKDCDLTAMKGDELVIAEFKRHLSLELMLQGISRQKWANWVYLVIPNPYKSYKKWQDILFMIKKLGLGLITVTFFSESMARADIVLEPESSHRTNRVSRKRKSLTREITARNMDGNLGGSVRKRLLTAYRELSIHIACCLEAQEMLSVAQLKAMGTDKRKTGSVLSNNFYRWFKRLSRGVYCLTDLGKEELHHYEEAVDFYRKLIRNHNGEKNL